MRSKSESYYDQAARWAEFLAGRGFTIVGINRRTPVVSITVRTPKCERIRLVVGKTGIRTLQDSGYMGTAKELMLMEAK